MDLKNFNFAPLYTLDKEWALVTASDGDSFNTMTVSWGGFGTLFGKPVVTIYIRPVRHTYGFIERSDFFTLSFYDEVHKKDLAKLGSVSGKNTDKIELTSLTPKFLENAVTFKQARLTLVCKKIYSQDLDTSRMPNDIQTKFYGVEPAHRMYIGEVVDIINN